MKHKTLRFLRTITKITFGTEEQNKMQIYVCVQIFLLHTDIELSRQNIYRDVMAKKRDLRMGLDFT